MKKKLYVIADSISMHYGPYLKQYLGSEYEYTRKGEGHDFGNINDVSAVNGGDSSCVLAYLDIIMKNGFTTDLLLLNCGLHDIKTNPETENRQVSLDDYKKNLEEVVLLINKHNINTCWVRTTPADHETHKKHCSDFWRFNEDVIAYNEAADKIMHAANIKSIDLYNFTANLKEELYCDHVHFTDNVRKLQAAFIAGHITSMS